MKDVHDLEALARVDLNLLVALDLLLQERHVTRAAARAGVTQSAMSHALRRLRAWFDDPLLVRGPGGMVATARAESVVEPVHRALVELRRALSDPDGFRPETSRRRFTLLSPLDAFDALFVPPLLQRLRTSGPSLELTVLRSRSGDIDQDLATAEHDLWVGVLRSLAGFADAPPGPASGGLVARTLYREQWCLLVRRDHPLLEASDLEGYLAADHLLVSTGATGRGVVDTLLAEQGRVRRVVARVPGFFLASEVLATSDLVLTAPNRVARALCQRAPLAQLPVPLALPTYPVSMVWHPRADADPAHRWLRAQVQDLSRIRT